MTCDICEKALATQVITKRHHGQKVTLYRCDACLTQENQPPPPLNRPCTQCKQREGDIKLVRLRPKGRVVTYVCEMCVSK